MPLKIIIVGAGIAGLCSATALRQAGHSVQILEKSSFAAETGAALVLAPNGARVLSSLGFSFEEARACRLQGWETCHGTTLEPISCVKFDDAQERYGAPVWSVHRVDFHNELLRLALKGSGAATLRLNAKVRTVDPRSGIVELDDGSSLYADLIVAADGVHSITRAVAIGDQTVCSPSGMSASRFLLPTEVVRQNKELSKLLDRKGPTTTLFADTSDSLNERHMIWYGCRSGEVQNFAGIHPTGAAIGTATTDEKTAMLQEFSHFHPSVVDIMKLAEDVKCWPLLIHDPLPTWIYGKIVLIGDAAHPMLPFGGQGSNQAIEDGGALGYVLRDVNDAATLTQRLKVFETLRRDRASRVQILSKVRVGEEKVVEQEVRKFAGGMDSVPTSFPERLAHDYGFDVLGKCAEAVASL